MPTIATNRPSTAEASVRGIERPASPITSDRPRIISAKNSGGPKRSPSRASGWASSTSPIVASVPPMKEPIAAMASAAPARPWRAIW